MCSVSNLDSNAKSKFYRTKQMFALNQNQLTRATRTTSKTKCGKINVPSGESF